MMAVFVGTNVVGSCCAFRCFLKVILTIRFGFMLFNVRFMSHFNINLTYIGSAVMAMVHGGLR